MTMTTTIQTQGTVFNIVSVAKIAGTKKDFHAITFTHNGRKMVVGHSKTEGAKFFWYVEGRGTQQMTKNDLWKWLNKYDGKDARKLAGYAKMMQPVSMYEAVDTCKCGRGVDHRTATYSIKNMGAVLCKPCQFTHGDAARQSSATNGSARNTLFGIPIFTWEELTEKKAYQLAALLKQLQKVEQQQGSAMRSDERHAMDCYQADICCVMDDQAFDNYVNTTREMLSEPAKTEAVTEGEGTEPQETERPDYVALVTLDLLKDYCKQRGWKGVSKMKKMDLLTHMADLNGDGDDIDMMAGTVITNWRMAGCPTIKAPF